jgi:hypothetical protein
MSSLYSNFGRGLIGDNASPAVRRDSDELHFCLVSDLAGHRSCLRCLVNGSSPSRVDGTSFFGSGVNGAATIGRRQGVALVVVGFEESYIAGGHTKL